MPFSFFSRGFSSSKTPPRRSQSLSSLGRSQAALPTVLAQDYNRINMSLADGHSATFEDGVWRTEDGKEATPPQGDSGGPLVLQLQRRVQQLEDDNRLLQLKTELLLDMLTEKTAEHLLSEQTQQKKTGDKKGR